jgi:hypothetical protein
MMFVDFQQVGRPVVRCLFGAGPVTEACSSFFGEIDPRPVGRLAAWWGAEVGKKEGVHNVHTLGLGSGLLCLATWVTVVHQDIGDSSGILGGDTSAILIGG